MSATLNVCFMKHHLSFLWDIFLFVGKEVAKEEYNTLHFQGGCSRVVSCGDSEGYRVS